ncbi:hypothetical protein PIB30_044317 [Stylosanthes scabra]|uniref:Ninja-family protein n=1 Tax=Stylosanthes scabra TaxID=79078 RepID=A0ABU6YD72_9FABA|nr:hypothetical protein [Stylosanthes scabra]
MAQVVEERENSSTRMSNNFPRDLLKRFMSVNHHHHGDGDAEQEIELSLGLSMNGRFGVDPTAKKIKRTTSIPEFSLSKPLRDKDNDSNNNNHNNQDIGGYSNNMPMPCTTNLIRTCSLPTETEEEWRKRKELQTLRRLEARRKRSEKQQRNIKAMREKGNRSSPSFSEDFVDGNNNSNLVEATLNEFSSLGRTTSLSSRVSELGLNGEKKSGGCGCGGLPPPSPSPSPSTRGPFGSPQGAASSGISESESPPGQGSRPGDVRSPVGSDTFPTTTKNESSNKHSRPANKTKEIVKSLLEDMPCVSTKFDGPNGKKIEGFLYRYGKGLEVRIVCVCHGSFLTPAEFVKHGGGGDVSNPLKHIVVSPGGCS